MIKTETIPGPAETVALDNSVWHHYAFRLRTGLEPPIGAVALCGWVKQRPTIPEPHGDCVVCTELYPLWRQI